MENRRKGGECWCPTVVASCWCYCVCIGCQCQRFLTTQGSKDKAGVCKALPWDKNRSAKPPRPPTNPKRNIHTSCNQLEVGCCPVCSLIPSEVSNTPFPHTACASALYFLPAPPLIHKTTLVGIECAGARWPSCRVSSTAATLMKPSSHSLPRVHQSYRSTAATWQWHDCRPSGTTQPGQRQVGFVVPPPHNPPSPAMHSDCC